ncbi:MAG: hypothetical protein JSR51_07755 [Proteobacteria bacterium]|nr:hypothetical protein [Pseudomonadota bacterium]
MKKKITTIATIIMLSSASMAASPLVSDQQAMDIAGDMYRTAMFQGIGGMIETENKCWGIFKQNATEFGVAACALYAMSGTIIDATFARTQRRGSLPAYNAIAANERVIRNASEAGFSEDQARSILESSVRPHAQNVLTGLMNAGMR